MSEQIVSPTEADAWAGVEADAKPAGAPQAPFRHLAYCIMRRRKKPSTATGTTAGQKKVAASGRVSAQAIAADKCP